MRSYINKFKLLLVFIMAAGLVGCGPQLNEDMKYSNEYYSYESAEEFQWDTWCPYDESYLKVLRETYGLEELAAQCRTDFEKVQVITNWVTNLWEHDGDNIPEQSDPLYILQKVTEEQVQYRCVEYGVVIAGCLNSLGIPARTIGLKTQDVETREYAAGHVATEVYVKDFDKWVFVDGQWGLIPMMGELPLNAVQLGEVIDHPEKYEESLSYLSFQDQQVSALQYNNWIMEYLYYFDVTGYKKEETGFAASTLMLTPVDAPNPTVFQQKYPLEVDYYTHSVPEFYPVVK